MDKKVPFVSGSRIYNLIMLCLLGYFSIIKRNGTGFLRKTPAPWSCNTAAGTACPISIPRHFQKKEHPAL